LANILRVTDWRTSVLGLSLLGCDLNVLDHKFKRIIRAALEKADKHPLNHGLEVVLSRVLIKTTHGRILP